MVCKRLTPLVISVGHTRSPLVATLQGGRGCWCPPHLSAPMGITVFTIIDENNMFCFSRVIPYIVLQRSSALDGGLSFLRRRTSAYTLAAPPEAARPHEEELARRSIAMLSVI